MIDPTLPLAQLAAQTAARFQQRFGRVPRWIAAGPGRVNIIGEHTDYNDGFVLPMAIDRYTLIAADFAYAGTKVQWHCAQRDVTAVFDLATTVQKGEPKWSNYVRGVFAGFQRRGQTPKGLDVVMDCTVPLGGGLSSSASLEVAAATLVELATGKMIDPVAKALICQKAEHEFAGVPCGIMDQFISVMGQQDQLLLLDCRTRQTQLVALTDPEIEVLIANTNVKHELGSSQYAVRRKQCEDAAKILGVMALRDVSMARLEAACSRLDPVVFRRAKHVVGEIERTVRAATEVRASNWPLVGELMYASHHSLRDDYEVSCRELDVMVEIAQSIGPAGGVIGSRMTGGGFGGCTVSLVRKSKVNEVARKLAADYEARTKIKPSLFVSRPAQGAVVLKG
jgi:galactokinase